MSSTQPNRKSFELEKNHPFHNINKYLYIIKRPGLIRLMYTLSALAYIIALFALTGFISINIWTFLFFGPVIGIIGYYRLVAYIAMSQYPGFDVKKHNKMRDEYWKKMKGKEPSVDIFLPICG